MSPIGPMSPIGRIGKPPLTTHLFDSHRQSSRGPPAGCGRDVLVVPVWEPALVIRLERLAPRLDLPGTVGRLGPQEKPHALSVRRVGDRESTGLVQRKERAA